MLMEAYDAAKFISRHLLGLLFLPVSIAASAAPGNATSKYAVDAKVEAAYGKLPMSFVVNQGQTDEQVRFISRGAGYSLFLTPSEAVFSLQAASAKSGHRDAGKPGFGDAKSAVIRMAFNGANKNPVLSGEDKQAGVSNYLIGNDPGKWQKDVANYGRVKYHDIYPGIDAVYYGNQEQLEYDLIVAANADPNQIELKLSGVESMSIDGNGNLILNTGEGYLVQHAPIIYQTIDGKRKTVDGKYALHGRHKVGFEVGQYNKQHELVIDPVLAYSSYLGGTGTSGTGAGRDIINQIAVDGFGNVYTVGTTNSVDFPTQNAYQATAPGAAGFLNVVVTKISVLGNSLIYSTYIGGSVDDDGLGIAVDAYGSAYITGDTQSTNFPVLNAYQATKSSVNDVFVTKLNPNGNGLEYSTYLGGTSYESGYDIAIDGNRNAYITGRTNSTDFPVSAAIQASKSSLLDGFIAKLHTNGNILTFSTYFGGTGDDYGNGIAVNSSGNAYITGHTNSTDFPTENAFQASRNGNRDGFVVKLGTLGTTVEYSTYLGGTGNFDSAEAIAVDSDGNAYVTGYTDSTDFPLAGTFVTTNGGSNDCFLTKIDSSGASLIFSSYTGGNSFDSCNDVAVDKTYAPGYAYITGATDSTNFPQLNDLELSGLTDSNAFVRVFDANGTPVEYSTLLGGGGVDIGTSIAVDSAGNAYVAGETTSSDFAVVNAYQSTKKGVYDAFVSKIARSTGSVSQLSINDVSVTEGASGTLIATFTVSLDQVSDVAVIYDIATNSGGTATVTTDYTGKTLLDQVIPAGTLSKTFTVTVKGDAIVEANETFIVNVTNVSGAVFKDSQAIGTILNDDGPTLSINDVVVTEGASGTILATFTVSLSEISATDTSYTIATNSGGTATVTTDYTGKTLIGETILAGASSKTFSVIVKGDTAIEPNETFFVNLTNAVGASIYDSRGVGTIDNDDVPSLSIDNVSVTEGASGTVLATFTVSLSAAASTSVSYTIATNSGGTATVTTDYTGKTLVGETILAGALSKTFSVIVKGDTSVEANETFIVNVTGVTGATVADSQGIATIINDDGPTLSINDVNVIEGNSGTILATFTVSLSQAALVPVTYTIATNSGGTATVTTDYTGKTLVGESIAAGLLSKTFSVIVKGDTDIEANETFLVNLSSAVDASVADSQGIGTITNDD